MELERLVGDYRISLLAIPWAVSAIGYLFKGTAKLNTASRDCFSRTYTEERQKDLDYLQSISPKFQAALCDFFIASILLLPATTLLSIGKGESCWACVGAAIFIVAALSRYMETLHAAKLKKELGLK